MNEKEELVNLTKDLIQFKSTKDKPEEIKKCMKYISNYFENSVFMVKEFEHNGKFSMVVSFEDKKSFDLIINGHIDVVEADEEQFNPRVEENKLFGRGAVDMKAGIAASMLVMKNAALQKSKPNIALMIVGDEEIGGFNGTNYLVNELNYTAKFVIAAEPNHVDSIDKLNILVAEKGVLWLKIKTKGIAAHAARPWLGKNAIDLLIKKYTEIKKLFAKNVRVENFWQTTINLSTISAGTTANKVPDNAEMILDIRYVETDSIESILQKLNLIKDIEIEVLTKGSMIFNKEMEKIYTLVTTIKEITKNDVELIKESGSSDLRFTSENKIPSVLCGPCGKNYHGKDEFVYISSLELIYKTLNKFVIDNY